MNEMYLYHVLGEKYIEGEPIYSLQMALEKGVITEDDYQWGDEQPLEEYHDYFNICFFDNLQEAKRWALENKQTRIAKVDTTYIGEPTFNEEGHLVMELGKIEPHDIVEIIKVK